MRKLIQFGVNTAVGIMLALAEAAAVETAACYGKPAQSRFVQRRLTCFSAFPIAEPTSSGGLTPRNLREPDWLTGQPRSQAQAQARLQNGARRGRGCLLLVNDYSVYRRFRFNGFCLNCFHING
ncbi:MAG: hypothetical protein H6642_16305 [Caldilineaceae bacterium]|nr:hypothetical protein [Caldilineaceae bacterium]